MDMVTVVSVNPQGGKAANYGQIEGFASNLNHFYSLFNIKIEVVDYGKTLDKSDKGLYNVMGLQSTMITYIKKSMMCFIMLNCDKNAVDPLSMAMLMKNLGQYKKTETVAYFAGGDQFGNAMSDMSRRMAAKNQTIPIPRENRVRLDNIAKSLIDQGVKFDRSQKLREAEACFQQAQVIWLKLSLTDENAQLRNLVLANHNIASILFREKRMKPAQKLYEDAIAARKKADAAGITFENDNKKKVDLQLKIAECTNLGLLYSQDQKIKEAEEIYKDCVNAAEELLEMETNQNARMLAADSYGNLGALYNSQKKDPEAMEAFGKMIGMLKVYRETDDTSEAVKKKYGMAGNSLAILNIRNQRFEEALAVLKDNYELYEELLNGENAKDYEPPMALVCYNMAFCLRSLRRPQESVPYAKRAQDICAVRKDDNTTCKNIYDAMVQEGRQAIMQQEQNAARIVQMADSLRQQAKYQDAVQAYRQGAALYGGLPGVENRLKMASIYDEIATMLWDYVQIDQAAANFNTALNIYRDVVKVDESRKPDLAVALFNVGRFYEETKDLNINEYFKEAFEIASAYKDQSEKAMEIYENLEDMAEELENYVPGEAPSKVDEEILETFAAEKEVFDEEKEAAEKAAAEEAKKAEEASASSGGFFKKLFGKKK